MNTSNNVEVIQRYHGNFFDLESFLNDLYDIPDPNTANINHVFWVKNSQHALVIFKSSMVRQVLNRIVRGTTPTALHRVREGLETFSNT